MSGRVVAGIKRVCGQRPDTALSAFGPPAQSSPSTAAAGLRSPAIQISQLS